jgi:hypothetical protein
MLQDNTVHFSFSVDSEALKAEADPKGRGGSLVTKLTRRCRIWSRPGYSGWQCSIRRTRLMGTRMSLGLCDGKVQRSHTAQEFRASIEMKTGSISAEVAGECFEAVTSAGRVHDIESDRELHRYSYGLALVEVLPIVQYEGISSNQTARWFYRKQYFKREWNSLFLRRLDE